MLRMVVLALALRLIGAASGSSDKECGNLVTPSSDRVQSNQELVSSESAQCHICGLSFKNLAIHMDFHNHQKPFKCSQCDKQFTRASSLQSHQQMHSGKKLHDCFICDKQFTCPETLRKHQQMHTDVKSFRCPECGKQLASAHRLRTHQRTHTGERPFICPECGKQFARSDTLRDHQRTHTNVTLFRCTECGKQFARPYNLLRHQRMHTGVKPFNCSYCGKQFMHTYTMRIHLLRHEMPFECLECGMRFERADCLRDHRLKDRAVWVNTTGGSSPAYAENSTAVVESPSLFLTILRCPLESWPTVQKENLTVFNYPPLALENLTRIQSFAQMKNLNVTEKSPFLHPVFEILMNGTSSAEMEVSTEMKDPFLLQSVLKNTTDGSSLMQMNNLTEVEKPFVLQVENHMHDPSVPEDRTARSFLDHLQIPTIFGNTFLFEKLVPNPSQGGTVLEKLIGNPFSIQTDKHSVPQTSLNSGALFVQMQEHIPTNGGSSMPDVQLPSGNSVPVSRSTYLECPVCFGRFDGRAALKEHLLNSSCSLYPLDWQPYLGNGDNDDFAN